MTPPKIEVVLKWQIGYVVRYIKIVNQFCQVISAKQVFSWVNGEGFGVVSKFKIWPKKPVADYHL